MPVTGNSLENDGQLITGAGAHFSWVVFDAIKPELERISGRKLKLYGKESMLGAGCNAGIKSALNTSATQESFGFVCCPLSDKEVKEKGLRVFPLAQEPVLILVNADNPINSLTRKQVRSIFSGNTTNWKQVGGNDEPVVVVARLHCKSRPGHWKTILPGTTKFSRQRLNVQSAAEMVNRVSDFKTAIGHTGSAWAFDSKARIKIIRVDGSKPTAANLKTKKYPFYRQLSAVTSKDASAELVNLMQSAQRIMAHNPISKRYELLPLANPE